MVHAAGLLTTVQDLGREGYLAQGLSRGGAVDRLALYDGAALLDQGPDAAALEMAGIGGEFSVTEPVRFALTGAPMRARLDDRPLSWNTSDVLYPGQRLIVEACDRGHFGYLSLAGGLDVLPILDSRSTDLSCGLGRPVRVGDRLPIGPDPRSDAIPCFLPPSGPDRCGGGTVRFVAGPQTDLFPGEVLARFCATEFHRSLKGNRQGVHLSYDGPPFATRDHLASLSAAITPGDIQMTGAGTPVVLLPECQTVGGYPRIGTVVPWDLPLVAQAAPSAPLHFTLISRDEALTARLPPAQRLAALRARVVPQLLEPASTVALLHGQLISGVATDWEDA